MPLLIISSGPGMHLPLIHLRRRPPHVLVRPSSSSSSSTGSPDHGPRQPQQGRPRPPALPCSISIPRNCSCQRPRCHAMPCHATQMKHPQREKHIIIIIIIIIWFWCMVEYENDVTRTIRMRRQGECAAAAAIDFLSIRAVANGREGGRGARASE